MIDKRSYFSVYVVYETASFRFIIRGNDWEDALRNFLKDENYYYEKVYGPLKSGKVNEL